MSTKKTAAPKAAPKRAPAPITKPGSYTVKQQAPATGANDKRGGR